jgi:hypothetical protein
MAVTLAACVNANPTGGGGPLGVEPDDGQAPILSPLSDVTTTTGAPRVCAARPLQGDFVLLDNPKAATLRLSQAIYPCADHVVVASPAAVAIADGADTAVAERGVLLVVDPIPTPEQLAEVARLEPDLVTVFGVPADAVPGSWDVIDPAAEPSSTTTTTSAVTTSTLPPDPPVGDADEVWLVPADSRLADAVRPAAVATGSAVVAVAVDDLRTVDADTRSTIATAETSRLFGAFGPDSEWQLAVVQRGDEVPGGGQVVFPGRRFVALYGNPLTSALGVLGEQDAQATLERAREVASGYETGDEVVVVPTFEIIATVASAQAGADNDYSSEMSIADLQEWVDLAGANDAYVVLDLQPGRTDFLTQAKRYEELLRLPHVGLALDPEWRLKPDQVHLRQIGTVTAAEINSVSEWLAGIVREEALPQKLFLIHQFRFSMITDRETIEAPSELAVVIQMDGQGPLSTKYLTYDQLTADTENAVWRWGWKNFYDEDSPRATPEQTLAVDPEPVFISYQ